VPLVTAESELTGFIEKFSPEMQDQIRSCRAKMAELYPTAVQLVYDNYNFLVIGFGPTERPSEAIFSLAAHRRGVTLCFLQRGPELPDPTHRLRGSGSVVRNVALETAADLDHPDVQALMSCAIALASVPMNAVPMNAVPMDASGGGQVVIRSVSAKQRPRR